MAARCGGFLGHLEGHGSYFLGMVRLRPRNSAMSSPGESVGRRNWAADVPAVAASVGAPGIGGEDLDVVQAAAARAGAAVGDGGDHLAVEGRLEEVDVDAGGHGDGVLVGRARVGRVAGEGEGGIGEGEDHSAVGHAEAVEHFLPEGHADGRVAVVQLEDFDAHPFGGIVVFQDLVGCPGNCRFSHASLPPALFTECSCGTWRPSNAMVMTSSASFSGDSEPPGLYHSTIELMVPNSSRVTVRGSMSCAQRAFVAGGGNQLRHLVVEGAPAFQGVALDLGVAPQPQQQGDERQPLHQHRDGLRAAQTPAALGGAGLGLRAGPGWPPGRPARGPGRASAGRPWTARGGRWRDLEMPRFSARMPMDVAS